MVTKEYTVETKAIVPELKDYPVVMVDPKTLVTASFNPHSRTDDGKLSPLLDKMRDYGFLPFFPILISKDGQIGEGNRRLACALKLGLDEVAVVYTNMTAEEIYDFNTTHMRHTPTQWLQAYLLGYEDVPQTIMRHIQKLEDAVGREYLSVISKAGYSPTIYSTARTVANYTGVGAGNVEFLGQVVRWLVENKQQFAVRTLMRSGLEPSVIAGAINENVPLVDTKR